MAVLGAAAGGGKSVLQTISFINSTTWSPAQDMNAKIYVVGGGGSGGYANYNATGGGAGGCAVTIIDLDASTTYTITIGAPGAATAGQSTGVVGNAGGASSFAGSGVSTMTGSGGGGGQKDTTGNGSGTANGGTGGSASGGTYGNFTGGAGGAVTAANTGAYYKATGGGAVGLWATGTAAPAVTGSANNPSAGWFYSVSGYPMAAASGASIGGTYLNFLVDEYDSTYSDLIRQPAGGLISLSSMGGGTHLEHSPYNFQYSSDSIRGALPMGIGSPPFYSSGNQSINNIQAGIFAGGGPSLSNTTASYWGLAGTGGLGGGGGASLGMAGASDYWNVGGQGGGGCVLIEVLEYK
tara:strand:- start:294 stop:1349 length:1056 start_codon:yes stop_codon:yes gene_type:complete